MAPKWLQQPADMFIPWCADPSRALAIAMKALPGLRSGIVSRARTQQCSVEACPPLMVGRAWEKPTGYRGTSSDAGRSPVAAFYA